MNRGASERTNEDEYYNAGLSFVFAWCQECDGECCGGGGGGGEGGPWEGKGSNGKEIGNRKGEM